MPVVATLVKRRHERLPPNQGSPSQDVKSRSRVPVPRNPTRPMKEHSDSYVTPVKQRPLVQDSPASIAALGVESRLNRLPNPNLTEVIRTVRRELTSTDRTVRRPVSASEEAAFYERLARQPTTHTIQATRHRDRAGNTMMFAPARPDDTPPVRVRPRVIPDKPDIEDQPDAPSLLPSPPQPLPESRAAATQTTALTSVAGTQTVVAPILPTYSQNSQEQATVEADTQTNAIDMSTRATQTNALGGMNALGAAAKQAQGASPDTLVSLLEELQRNPQLQQLVSARLLRWDDLLSDKHETLPDGSKVRVVDARKLLALQQRLSTLAQKEAGKLQNIKQVAVQRRTVPGNKAPDTGAIYPGVSVFMYPREMPAGRPGS